MVLALLLLFWSYRAAPAGAGRWVCLFLKMLGLVALTFCLLEPLWSGQRARPGANLFAILASFFPAKFFITYFVLLSAVFSLTTEICQA